MVRIDIAIKASGKAHHLIIHAFENELVLGNSPIQDDGGKDAGCPPAVSQQILHLTIKLRDNKLANLHEPHQICGNTQNFVEKIYTKKLHFSRKINKSLIVNVFNSLAYFMLSIGKLSVVLT